MYYLFFFCFAQFVSCQVEARGRFFRDNVEPARSARPFISSENPEREPSSFQLQNTQTGPLCPSMYGRICTKNDQLPFPRFPVFFSGYQAFTDEDGIFHFPLEKKEEPYFLFLGHHACINSLNSNTVHTIRARPQKKYACYKFSYDKEKEEWKVEPCGLEEYGFELSHPERCIIVPISPRFVTKVEVWPLKANSSSQLFLPKIILNSVTLNELKKESEKALCHSMDLWGYHSIIGFHKKQEENTKGRLVISITKP